MTEDNLLARYARRAITIPLYYAALTLVVGMLPLLLVTTFFIDLFRKTKWATTRALTFLVLYLGSECLIIFLAFWSFVFTGRLFGLGRKTYEKCIYRLQTMWGGWLYFGVVKIYGMRIIVDEEEGIQHGPLMLFFRHASLPDTSLPGALFLLRHQVKIRYIMKRELLWDPVLDIGGNTLPHFFVRRGATENAKEIEGIRRVSRDLEEDEAVAIFPEGTRYTWKKQKRILQKLAEKGDAYLMEKAGKLKNVLPPRLGGALAMLEENTKGHAVFAAHIGFEAANKALNVLNGSLVHQTIRVKMWKIPFDKIPKTREERIEWLYEMWEKIDEWIEEHKRLYPVYEEAPAPALAQTS